MLDFEMENNRLYFFTCGKLGRYYDGLFDRHGISLDENKLQRLLDTFLDVIEAQQREDEEKQRRIEATKRMNALFAKENQELKDRIYNTLENEGNKWTTGYIT